MSTEVQRFDTEMEAVTRNVQDFNSLTENLYETVSLLSKRADQISLELKHELNQKVEEFATSGDNLEEVFENREQIEVARHYERFPKPSLIAIQEYLDEKIYYRNPHKEDQESK